jgi:hypothetical protein
MIFSPENIELIREGKKTETRRIWKKPHVKVGKTYQCRTSRYAKTPEDSPYIKITAMRKERLGEITPEAAKREGMDSGLKVFQFRELWVKLHGLWDPDQEVYVVDFEVVGK